MHALKPPMWVPCAALAARTPVHGRPRMHARSHHAPSCTTTPSADAGEPCAGLSPLSPIQETIHTPSTVRTDVSLTRSVPARATTPDRPGARRSAAGSGGNTDCGALPEQRRVQSADPQRGPQHDASAVWSESGGGGSSRDADLEQMLAARRFHYRESMHRESLQQGALVGSNDSLASSRW